MAWLKNEPVLVAGLLTAIVQLGFAVANGNVTEGVVTAVLFAAASLFMRQKVTPASDLLDGGTH